MTRLLRVAVPERDDRFGPIPQRVLNLISRAGLQAVLIPIGVPADSVSFDGLLLTGGPNPTLTSPIDVIPESTGTDVHPVLDRDVREIAAIDVALRRGLPVLGICRGAELLAIRFGATLASMSAERAILHRAETPDADGRRIATHDVFILEGSRLRSLLSASVLQECVSAHELSLNLAHAQELRSSAHAPDGSVEAIEHLELPVLGVMWHPEDSHHCDNLQVEIVRRHFTEFAPS